MNRRTFIGRTAAAAGAILTVPPSMMGAQDFTKGLRFGACVVNFEQAKQAGLDGIEVGVGDAADRLQIADPKVREGYKEQTRRTGIPVCSLMMGLLNSYPLATDPRAPAWLEQSIDAAKDLGARVILVAFFGNGDLLDKNERVKEAELEVAIKRLKAAAPRAKDAGVILAIENYLNGKQNLDILERVNHDSVQVYYDVYNTGATKGHDVPADIRLLRKHIVQFHFKNGPKYLENGQVRFEPIAAAMKEIQYKGWIVLETSSPSKDPVMDARRNGEFARRLFA